MEATQAQVREWGGSLGLVLPKEVVAHQKLKAGDTVEFLVAKKSNVLKEMFGSLPHWKKSTDQVMKEIDRELWGE